jgi:hypothetical protein
MSTYAQEQEPEKLNEVVISDSKFSCQKKIRKVIVKISAEELKKDQGQSVANHFKYGGRC